MSNGFHIKNDHYDRKILVSFDEKEYKVCFLKKSPSGWWETFNKSWLHGWIFWEYFASVTKINYHVLSYLFDSIEIKWEKSRLISFEVINFSHEFN